MLTRAETGRALAGGAISLAGLLLFTTLGIAALLQAGFSGSAAPLIDPYILRIVRFTLWQAVLSSGLSILIAIPVARALARQPAFPGRLWIIRMMGIPLGLPVIIGALGLIAVWGRNGWANAVLAAIGISQPVSIYGLTGILLAHVFFNFPLATRLLLSALERLPAEYWLIASNLGMRSGAIFRLIEWPALRAQIPALAGLILMLAATSFTLVLLLGGGPAATTLEVAIYQALRFDFDPRRAVSLALLQVAITAGILVLLHWIGGETKEGTSLGRAPRRPDGRLFRHRLADGAVLVFATAFVAMPLVAILIGGMKADFLRLLTEPIFLTALLTSLAIAVPSGLMAVLIAYAISAARLAILFSPGAPQAAKRLSQLAPSIASLVLLIPPTVLGTGWFLIAGPAEIETIAPLLIAIINGLMAFPFVLRVLDPALATHRERTLRLSASLGLSGFTRLRRIDWPALKGPVATALAFGVALSLGDLGVVALFGSDRLVTLPFLLYSRMGSYRTDDAAGLALILGLLCLALMFAGSLSKLQSEREE